MGTHASEKDSPSSSDTSSETVLARPPPLLPAPLRFVPSAYSGQSDGAAR